MQTPSIQHRGKSFENNSIASFSESGFCCVFSNVFRTVFAHCSADVRVGPNFTMNSSPELIKADFSPFFEVKKCLEQICPNYRS